MFVCIIEGKLLPEVSFKQWCVCVHVCILIIRVYFFVFLPSIFFSRSKESTFCSFSIFSTLDQVIVFQTAQPIKKQQCVCLRALLSAKVVLGRGFCIMHKLKIYVWLHVCTCA